MAPEINLVDPDTYQRAGPPHDQFGWLREHDPVHWHADGGGPGWPGFCLICRKLRRWSSWPMKRWKLGTR